MPANFYALKPQDIINWPAPNYEHPSAERLWLPEFALVWQAVTTILVWGRLYLRMTRKAGAWGYDDGLTLFAWVCAALRTSKPFFKAELTFDR
jgi:hypothetical protein